MNDLGKKARKAAGGKHGIPRATLRRMNKATKDADKLFANNKLTPEDYQKAKSRQKARVGA